MKTIKIHVDGMSCGHCVMRVQDAIERIEGVKTVKVSLGKKMAQIKMDEKIDPEIIINAVNETGYKASF